MSEENMNNNGEETAALFVSAHKKKQAEEEARKKAEAEQAKRDAAEAEVRRMEEEVEERKRKAEEERKALEEAEREREREKQLSAQIGSQIESGKEKVKAAVSDAKEKVKKEGGGKKLPIPLLAGIGVVVIAAIVLCVVFLVKGKGKGIDHSALEFDGKYDIQSNKIELSIAYPTSCFSEVTETIGDDGVSLSFTPVKGENVNLNMLAVNNEMKGGTAFTTASLANMSAKNNLEVFKSDCESKIKKLYGDDVAFTEETTTDISAETPGKYSYDCKIKYGDGMTGVCSGWFYADTDKEVKTILVSCTEKAESPEQAGVLCKAMTEKNTVNPVMIPGGNPPKSTQCDSSVRIDELAMGIPVPADLFNPSTGKNIWTDENGASIRVKFSEANVDEQGIIDNYNEVMEKIKKFSKEGSAGATYDEYTEGDVKYMESRNFISDKTMDTSEWLCGYMEEYDDVIGGIPYWERDFTCVWFRASDYKAYVVHFDTFAPKANRGQYQEIFDQAMKMMDI